MNDLGYFLIGFLNEKLKLSRSEVDLYSPLRQVGIGTPMTIAVGAAELSELIRHASEYAAAAKELGEQAEYVPLENLALSPQCGFASTEEGNVLAEEAQWAKLAMIVETARDVWG